MDQNSNPSIASVDQYYLQVQALTPLENSVAQAEAQENKNPTLFESLPPVNIFIIGIIITFVLLLSWRMVKLYGYSKTLGVAVMLLAVVGGFGQFNNSTSFSSKASPEFIPRELIVKDVSDDGFQMNWITTGQTVSAVKVFEVGEDESEAMTYLASQDESKVHEVAVDNLDSQTTYNVTIYSGGDWYGNENIPLQITTR